MPDNIRDIPKGGISAESVKESARTLSYEIADRFMETRYKTYDDVLRVSLAMRSPVDHPFSSTSSMSTSDLKSGIMSARRGTDYQFSSAGDIAIGDLTNQMIAVIQEDYNQNVFGETFLDVIFPDLGELANEIVIDVIAAPGGQMDAYTYGAAVPQVKRLGNRSITYQGQPYRNYIQFQEEEITYMRQLGAGYNVRGILQRVSYNILKMKTLMYNRKQTLKASIFDGSVTISPQGGQEFVVDYGIPAWNLVTNITGESWGTFDTTTGAITFNPLADPVADFVYFLNAYQPWFTRRGRLNRCNIVMNPITMIMITSSVSVRDRLVALQTGTTSPVAAQGTYTVDTILRSLLPGWEGNVMIEGAGFLLNDSDSSWDNASFGATAPPQDYFVPTGKVLFDVRPQDYALGNLIMLPAIQNGGPENPQPGEWLISQPLIGPGFPEGLQRPVLNIVGGFQGGLMPVHTENILIGEFATVIAS